jgi:endoglucanase
MQLLILLLGLLSTSFTATAFTCWHGTNLAGLDFGSIPGVFNKDYTVPTPAEVDYFMSKGMNVFRLPFRWERLQTTLNGPLDQTYLGYIDSITKYATGKGAFILLDPHNYARYNNGIIGQTVPTAAFADFWSKLANYYKSNDHIIFGLMNEPNTMSTELWLSDANAAIAAIRSTGATQKIFVPGNAWTGAWSWAQNWYGTPNAQVMRGIVDPKNNSAFEVHQYMDSDHSGTSPNCVSATVGSESLKVFTQWLRDNKFQGFLGEWAGGRNDLCYQAIADLTSYLDANSDVWLGFAWWAAGPWWGDYIYALDPSNGVDRPQMAYLEPHLKPGTC